ncbi:single-stranded-DNA-specific exonuclease RecJ [Candidatus Woesebacteria bacterium RIFCSPHIGHO2_01_FULL_39_17]|uniref:Single-stranded-DNA-specific exonuclease RecJ n=3 Tax=Candidatus Woeseibacteriota TaxID=1752722 RepID=A0A0G0NNG1_9BACT|nr:MAG: single-stranded-DNA-specific exonuclease RecJ, single-stranded-DNA-specific exonuclease [Microgenomates group bacterium GW2011_GWC1_38_12]KKQ93783.1 MAG: Single-stranded-DNA-specific exonuclease RecJ [Candidatus Woesebacteria bacterium GW2011_GWB1_39_10b]KKR14346.1 MAG: Single-stranded-DNA-specific exonuclease RecJ [Candidatus Woesebacteria bacterium GW2011_GWA1_39_21b]OGM23597.1 MAG: single-stranded-DNA-specific exonuclease RecJ [Candidatus Woesebacteria bacterium RIFCSPHIGHO2_01_FULL_3
MNNKELEWEILDKKGIKGTTGIKRIIDILLNNRGVKTKKEKSEFFKPTKPQDLGIKELGISDESLKKAIERIKKAIKKDEEMVIYGDYDADGICATAILWETLYSLTKNVKPYIPNRFEEGYGINAKSIENIKVQNPNVKLIMTVDNGIVANKAVDAAYKLGIDVIISDHHQIGRKLPKAYSIIHTDKISGSGIAWILSRELNKKLITNHQSLITNLELAAIGTIADQLPIIGPNRSFAKYGLEALNLTQRPGLLALFEEAGLTLQGRTLQHVMGTYDVNFVIAPRINAMGRMEHAIDSLRLLCTKNIEKARELAQILGRTNRERQRVVDEVVLHARELAQKTTWKGAIVLAHESYHEGVIGLAASKLVEEFYRPVVVLSKGEKISKASARSITGFNIIESIRKLDSITLGGGGHPMAAGFSIETVNIELFTKKIEEVSAPLLTEDILTKRLKIDMESEFENIDSQLYEKLSEFEPTGIGNTTPVFITRKVRIVDARTVGRDAKHLRLTLEKGGRILNAIAFGKGEIFPKLSPNKKIDMAYNITADTWNGNKSLQLKVKDIRI